MRLDGNRVVVTSFDSGELPLGESELRSGWTQCGRTAVSPPIVDPDAIPAAGHDEWYIFDGTPPDLSDTEVFVNYSRLSTVPVADSDLSETLDVVLRRDMEAIQARFWSQLERIEPHSYLADGDLVTFVTQSELERDAVLDYLRSLPTSRRTLPYWIQRADYSSTDFAPVDVTAALRAFASHDWSAEHALLQQLERSGRESCPPGIGFVDPNGPVLHICPGPDRHAMAHYQGKATDANYTREGVERSVVVHFIQCFFDDRHDVLANEFAR